MREETADWLNPMLEEANNRHMDLRHLMRAAMMPAAEGDTPLTDWLAEKELENPSQRVRVGAFDWVRYGELLRHELGWDDTYPAYPDFPEARDVP